MVGSAKAEAPPPLTPSHVVVVAAEGDAAVADADPAAEGAISLSDTHRRWAVGAVIGSLLGGLAGLIGLNGLLQFLTRSGRVVAKAAVAAAKAPVKAAKAAARVVGHAAKSPLKWAAGIGGLSLFLMTGISILDIQWQAGLLMGAAATAAGWLGLTKAKRRLTRGRAEAQKDELAGHPTDLSPATAG